MKKTISNLEEHIDSVVRGKEHLATKKDIKMIKKIFTNYCSYDQMDSFKAEMKPMMAAPMKLPERCCPDRAFSRVCQDAGICRSNRPNIDRIVRSMPMSQWPVTAPTRPNGIASMMMIGQP